MPRLSPAVLAGALLAAATPAAAQDQVERAGWTLGGMLGFGSFSLANADVPVSPDGDSVGALILGLHFGGFLRPDLALVVELGYGTHDCSDCGVSDQLAFNNLGIAARYWWLDELWVEGGLGSARTARVVDGDRAWLRTGISLFGAAAYELLQHSSYALDLQLRVSLATYKDTDTTSSSAALLLGLSWF